MDVLRFLLPFMLVIVLGILVAGIIVMAKGGETSRKYSNKLMQARVLAQFVAVIVIVLLFVLSGRS
ncbi:twin transmembrane helix small protein [Govanella unica]|uniref:Twin transmembrane helix small protein n=1 Tax=Govanella unica TaxID=2975056 RepID=A0A9X3TW36_9PROT|nr:twin transmembrane helix small protein [Govania unica]MDA5192624.1 twin transmembrane helix small protein [Govania unica]